MLLRGKAAHLAKETSEIKNNKTFSNSVVR